MSDTAAEYLDLVRATPNTPDGARRIVENGKLALDRIDWEITQLFDQRRLAHGLIVQFAQLERILTGAEPLTEKSVEEIAGPPTALTGERVRKMVLDVAGEASNPVDVDAIVDELRRRLWGQELPWSNPQAAIGTILYQSEKWKRVGRGVFERELTADDLPF